MAVKYRLTVQTGSQYQSGSFDRVSVMLIGRESNTDRIPLEWSHSEMYFNPGSSHTFEIESRDVLGAVLLLVLHKESDSRLVSDDTWFCHSVKVLGPDQTLYTFPCYSWLTNTTPLAVIEGTARKKSQYVGDFLQKHWANEMKARQEGYQWLTFAERVPRCINAKRSGDLPREAQHRSGRPPGKFLDLQRVVNELGLSETVLTRATTWANMRDVYRVCSYRETSTSVYVAKHWKEDPFFGYQYLNGSNPVLIRQCRQLPPNLPLTDQMVAPSLGPDTSLQQQLQAGNLYVVDYEILRGITPHIRDGEQQYLSAPICLLYLTPDRALIPIAIQVDQDPGPHNPIFLPSDPKYTWRLAKIWVRHADTQIHQIVSHLLRTHLLAEVFCVAAMRTLPNAHPLFKLLMPHIKFTLHINTQARKLLISEGGVFDKAFSTGGVAKAQVLQRATERITYTSLCLPEELASRGVDKLPNYYYRDDGLRIWGAISSFVQDIVGVYYEDDGSVGKDSELQAFVKEVFTEGFLSRSSSGIPSSLTTKAELVKYLTMAIFSCSGQHCAVNSGQFDFGAWMPNNPCTMRRPPPADKDKVTKHDIWHTLPDTTATTTVLTTIYLLSQTARIEASLGLYTEERFTEPGPRECIERFQSRLKQIKKEIDSRNEGLELPYVYLRPDLIENSVAI